MSQKITTAKSDQKGSAGDSIRCVSAPEGSPQTTARLIQFKPRPKPATFPPIKWEGKWSPPDFTQLGDNIFIIRALGYDADCTLDGDVIICQKAESAALGELVIVQRLDAGLAVRHFDDLDPGERIVGRAIHLLRYFGGPTLKEVV